VFGRATGFPATVELGALDGHDGLRLDGLASSDNSGTALAGGDVNGDGLSDVLIGAPRAESSGSVYVVFGNGAPLSDGTPAMVGLLEDDADPPGTSIATLVQGHYLDADPFAGIGITVDAPLSTLGYWQYRLDPTADWSAVPSFGLADDAALVLGATSELRFHPALDTTGSLPTLSVRLWDGTDATWPLGVLSDIRGSIGSLGGFSNDANLLTIGATVIPVNDAPSFTAADPPPIDEDAGAQQIAAWATFDPGAPDETGQTATYTVSNVSAPELFAALPEVSPDGTLSWALLPDRSGSVGFDVVVHDDGGTANGGGDTSPVQHFTLVVNPVNDAPSFSAQSPAELPLNAGAQVLAGWATFDPGASDEAAQTATYTVNAIDNPALFAVAPAIAADGSLSFTPATDASGSSDFTVVVRDSGGTANGGVDTSAPQTFTISIAAGAADRVFANGFD
jgi:hypothetical protein